MSKRKQQIEKQMKEQNEKERLESNAIELHGVVHETDLKLNGGEIEDSYFKWLEDNNLAFGGGLDHIDCTKDDSKEQEKVKLVNFVPWHSFAFLMASYFIAGLCVGKWSGDLLVLVVGILQAIQTTVLVYLSIRDLNK